MVPFTRIFLATIAVFCAFNLKAQFSGTSISEYQYGSLPDANESDFHSFYQQIRLNYTHDYLKISAGVQAFATPYSERNYLFPSWLNASYKRNGWEVKAGNFNETIGRGILLRTYEIPGALLEDKGFRSKNAFYRDLLGASVGYNNEKVGVKAFYAYAYNNLIPPSQPFDEQRTDKLAALSAWYKVAKQRIGISTMHIDNPAGKQVYGLAELNGKISSSLSYYTAYSQLATANDQDPTLPTPRAWYASLNWAKGKWGVSLEWKDYENFLLGVGVNEPPALIREHSYRTLNRTTHVLLPSNEKGLQIEARYQIGLWSALTLNYSFARNNFATQFDYHEWFAEWNTSIGDNTDLKLFADFAQDPFNETSDRFSTGASTDFTLGQKFGLQIDTEWQQFTRNSEKVTNSVFASSFRYRSKLHIGIVLEGSNDSFLTSDKQRLWSSFQARWKINSKHNLNFFAGERRGGPACNAGICYEQLDFKGIELRWVARL